MSLEGQRAANATPAAPAYRKGDDIAVVFARAVAYHHFGHFAEAKAGYKKVLKKRPNHFDALRRLGVCEQQTGNSESAERLLRRALLIDPGSAQARCDRGIVLAALQRQDEALACFDDLIVMKPDFADAHFHRGNLLLELRRFAEAAASYDNAIAVDPRHVNALTNRGNALHELERFAEAIASYDTALTLKPDCVPAIVNRGGAFKDLRQAERAIAEFDRALAIDPNDGPAWINRGQALLVLRRLDEARESFDRALAINSELALGWLGHANIFVLTGQLADALAACRRALAIEPNSVKALTQLGHCQTLKGDTAAAIACFDRALAIKPDEEPALSGRIFTEDFSVNADFAAHQAVRSEWWRNIGSKSSAEGLAQHVNDRDPNRRVVLGYVSADFRHHSAAYAFRPVLANHDKTRFEVICYSNTPVEDAITDSFRQTADQWRNVLQWSDDQLVDCIRADKVDILIDLSGHTEGNRLRTFARKPAPIQVTAWGHSTGTGLPTIDYLFSDPVSIPAAVRHLFAEKIYDLPCVIFTEAPDDIRLSDPPSVANAHVTFGTFNRLSKISDEAIGAWGRILNSVPGSRIVIKDFGVDSEGVRSALIERFSAQQIAADRVDLLGSTPRREHLLAYGRVDICLDPFPMTGGVSTWEALRMGVPVVTKLGQSVASRGSGAILSSIGKQEWVADSIEQYVAIAVDLANQRERLPALRRELTEQIAKSPAGDIVAYTRAVEAGYRTIWQEYCGR